MWKKTPACDADPFLAYYTHYMTVNQMEKMADESAKYARKSLAKSDELYALLSLLEAKSGKVHRYASIDDLFRKLKIS